MVRRPARPLVHLLALLGLALLAALLPPAAAAQWSPDATGLTDASYTSPTFYYGVRWHTAEWKLDQQSAGAAGDLLQLRGSDGGAVRYIGTTQFGDDPGACRDASRQALDKTPGVSDVELLHDSDGRMIWFQNAAEAWGFYVFRLASGGRSADWLAWFDCQTIVPGSAVLSVSQVGPAATFDTSHQQATRVVPSFQSVLPHATADAPFGWIWETDCWSDSQNLVDSGDGSPFTDAPPPAAGTTQAWYRLRWYQLADAGTAATVDADQIFLLDENDVVHWASRFNWSGDVTDPVSVSQTVAPGTGADLTLLFDLPEGTVPAQLFDATATQGAPTLATPIGCLGLRNGLAVRPQQSLFETETPQVSFVFGPAGTEQARVVWLDGATDPDRGDVVLLNVENTGQSAWTFDPAAIVAENRFNQPELVQNRPVAVQAGDPALPDAPVAVTAPVTLGPGDWVTLEVTYPAGAVGCSSLILLTDQQIVALGRGPCSAGGGAVPVIRTGE